MMKNRMRTMWAGLMMIMVMMMTGCQSPVAVGSLLRVVDGAMGAEAEYLQADRQRAGAWIEQQRGALTDAFDADLRERESLTTEWVRDHAMVYAMAREVLAEHAIRVDREYQTRQENLHEARRAQQAAMALIEQQDRLFEKVPDARRWLWGR